MKESIMVVLAMIIIFCSTGSARAADQKETCFNIGDTITVRGHVIPMINGGTYFVPLKQPCVHYPRLTDHFMARDLITMGRKLPPNIYMEITGQLLDPYPVAGVGIKVATISNVDTEVKAELADIRRSCEQWQKENSAQLSERTHGGRVVLNPQNSHGEDYLHSCSIWAVDTALPHESISIRRPVPGN